MKTSTTMTTMMQFTLSAVVAFVGLTAHSAAAQTKTITGESKTMTATIEAIEKSSREVTVKKPDGEYEVFYVPPTVKRFDEFKIGDKVRATYYENMVLRLKQPGEKDVDTSSGGLVKSQDTVSGTMSHQRTITATIAAIDMNVPSITITGPKGWKYSAKVQDKEALSKVKVGDKLDITWTEALIVSLEPGT